jgi:hypothetical protein
MTGSAEVARSRYFVRAHASMLALVVLGFAPTSVLRHVLPQPAVLDLPRLPPLFVVHGIILAAWYSFLVLQARWIHQRQVARHRVAGWFGTGLAAAVVLSTVAVVRNFPGRMKALATERMTTVELLEPGLVGILWLDVLMCLLFVGFVAGGVLARRQAQVHKRLMFFAGVTFLFAATARLGSSIALLTVPAVQPLLHFGSLLGLTLSLLVHDRRTLGRVHPTSWAGFAAYWGATLCSVLLAESAIGAWVLDW